MIENDYVIIEVIPTTRSIKTGDIAQLSALKISNNEIVDRFDYRLDKSKIDNEYILNMIDYDHNKFKYLKPTHGILRKLKKFIGNSQLLIIDNEYTKSYLSNINNNKVSFFDIFDIKTDDDSFDVLMKKYNIKPSNYLVDIMYEALIIGNKKWK